MAKSSILNVNDILAGYCDEIQKLIEEETVRIAKEGVKTLKETSPKNKRASAHRGRYAKGWK